MDSQFSKAYISMACVQKGHEDCNFLDCGCQCHLDDVPSGRELNTLSFQCQHSILGSICHIKEPHAHSDIPAPTVGMHAFSSGAKSSVKKPDYTKVPMEALEGIARRMDYGESRGYTWEWREVDGFRSNYSKGKDDPEFIRDRVNHAIEHLMAFANGAPFENLDAAICNLAMLEWFANHGTGFAKAFPFGQPDDGKQASNEG